MNEVRDIPAVAMDPNLRYRFQIIWFDEPMEIIEDVENFTLDNSVYYVFLLNDLVPEIATVRTIPVNHPDIKFIKITPYLKEDL